ncbi:MAG: hypothetical protein ACLFWD_06120 [Anaerolineales bacterium]
MVDVLEVEADLSVEPPEPRAFRWRGRTRTILDLGRRWQQENELHWLVRTPAKQVYELIYDLENGQWSMGRTPEEFQPRGPAA